MEKNLVSIIMPTFNCGDFISETIKTVMTQTYVEWELIIVDDCSTDDTVKKIEEMYGSNSQIRVTQLEKNSGTAVARNKGLDLAKGEYIAFLDSDDFWLPEKLEMQIHFMETHNSQFSATSYINENEYGELSSYKRVPPKRCNYNKMLHLSCPIGNSTVIFKRDGLEDVRVPLIRKRNDFALWLQILKKIDYCYGLDQVLTIYKKRSNSLSANKLKLGKYHWYLYRHIEKLNLPRSVFALFCWPIVKIAKIGYKKRSSEEFTKVQHLEG